jgi:copper resistance protein B
VSAARALRIGVALWLAVLAFRGAGAEEPADAGHVPPAPPTQAMPAMSYRDMIATMGMDDAAALGKVMLDQLEVEGGPDRTTMSWDAQAWYGTDYDKLWFRSEGTPSADGAPAARNELFWDHVISRWWSLQTGVRYDLGQGPARGWAAAGVEGLAPYRFDLEATLYLGSAGHSAALLRAQRDLFVTQRLIVQPELEAELYGSSDAARQLGAGLSNLQLALRARYELWREFAPYIGLAWRRDFGASANFARADGESAGALEWVAGLHLWW